MYEIVTPLAGVWIEILSPSASFVSRNVTPLAGVWIEIAIQTLRYYLIRCRGP